MTSLPSSQQPEQIAQQSAAKQLEDARMQDISLLLENLFEREEVTVKLLLDCLYDVGSVNLIDCKFQSRFLNGTLKSVARLSKPAFRLLALRWFKKNCPQLLTDWLRSKVTFQASKETAPSSEAETKDDATIAASEQGSPAIAPVEQAIAVPDTDSPNGTVAAIERDSQLTAEVKHLRSQMSLLTGLLIGAIALLGGGLFWINHTLTQDTLQPAQNAQSVKAGIGKRLK